jgi:hypothetical protein
MTIEYKTDKDLEKEGYQDTDTQYIFLNEKAEVVFCITGKSMNKIRGLKLNKMDLLINKEGSGE